MTKLPLTIATTDYDHFRDIREGTITPQGIDLNWLLHGHHECFARMTANREFDLSEMSFAKFSAQVTRDNSDLIGLPVICSRLFRFSSFYVNRRAGIETVEDLYGKSVGSPEWAHSAAVWMRGWMQNDRGMDMARIRWVQAGANAAGREEKVELSLPDGVEITRVKERSLSDMLASGDLDCAIIARPPTCFLEGHPDVVRLFPDFLEREEDQFAKTGVWPIMHIIAMKKSVHEAHPWAARNLFNAFDESRRRSVERILDPAVSRYPVAWLPTYAQKMQGVFGKALFPFGIEANRKTWEMMGLYTYQQGIAHRQFTPEEIFPTGIETKVII
jgi:4,5-dihydroxyphthalate decarboxylase